MDLSRRSFIKWVIGAGAAMACPVPLFAKRPEPTLGSESFSVCHSVRDEVSLPVPPPDSSTGVVIVGGGPSGLAAADELKGSDWLLLEKEPHLGGNCRPESWEGCRYSTAAAWGSAPDEAFASIVDRWKLDWKPISGEDSAAFEGKWIRNFWNGRADNPAFDELPYSKSVKDGFRQFLKDAELIDIEANAEKLDALAFSDLLDGYPPQLKAFWDQFGPSNWGAETDATSGYLGLSAARDWFKSQRYTWEGGMGVAAERVIAGLDPKRIKTGAYVYRVRRHGKKVRVSFFEDGKPRTIEAKAAVLATPKFFTKLLVGPELPEEQLSAMGSMRYRPYMVYNLCFDRRVYRAGYDNWPVGAKHFTDFIPADWVTNAEKGDAPRQVITVYAPKKELERAQLLDDSKVVEMAQAAVEELLAMFPSWEQHLREVRIHRRGHPLPMAIPELYSKLQPAARPDLPPLYFAHCDSGGEVSDFFYAALNGIDAAKKASKRL